MGQSRADFRNYILDQLSAVPYLSSSRFFGGTGLSSRGTQFAMLMDNALYFVVDERTRLFYEERGSECFWYSTKKGRVNVKRYYEVPPDMIEDSPKLLKLASESIAIAARSRS